MVTTLIAESTGGSAKVISVSGGKYDLEQIGESTVRSSILVELGGEGRLFVAFVDNCFNCGVMLENFKEPRVFARGRRKIEVGRSGSSETQRFSPDRSTVVADFDTRGCKNIGC